MASTITTKAMSTKTAESAALIIWCSLRPGPSSALARRLICHRHGAFDAQGDAVRRFHRFARAGLCLLSVMAVMFFWWREVRREAVDQRQHGPIVKLGFRYGMALFICSEVMFFVAFFWAYFGAALFPHDGVWPPKGIATFDPFDMPFIMTLILLLSGCTVTFAHHARQKGACAPRRRRLALRLRLACCSPAARSLNIPMPISPLIRAFNPSTFFMATGFPRLPRIRRHGVPCGLLVAQRQGRLHQGKPFRLRGRGVVLAFRRRVWLFLFTASYWWGSVRALPFRAMADSASLTDLVLRALACRCPRCGKGKLFEGLSLRYVDRCAVCNLPAAQHDNGDGPPCS